MGTVTNEVPFYFQWWFTSGFDGGSLLVLNKFTFDIVHFEIGFFFSRGLGVLKS